MCSSLEAVLNLCPRTSDFHGASSHMTATLLSYCFHGAASARINISFFFAVESQIQLAEWIYRKLSAERKVCSRETQRGCGSRSWSFSFVALNREHMKLQPQVFRAVGVMDTEFTT